MRAAWRLGSVLVGVGLLAGGEAIPASDGSPRQAARQLASLPPPYVVPVGRDLAALDWRVLAFEGRMPTVFRGSDDGRIDVITDSSMAVLYRPVRMDLAPMPCLSWRWRVRESTIPGVDLSTRGQDDRALMVSVGFAFVPAQANLWERLHHALVRQVLQREVPGHVLAYVWGGAGRRGDLVHSPQLETAGLMRILRPASTEAGVWHDETVDLSHEFAAHFGRPAPALVELAVLGDSDDTKARSDGSIADLRFSADCLAAAPAR